MRNETGHYFGIGMIKHKEESYLFPQIISQELLDIWIRFLRAIFSDAADIVGSKRC
jgi:hypothetical protein